MEEVYVAFGYYDGQLYGPYTAKQLTQREESGTVYCDTIHYFKEDETVDEAEMRLRQELFIEDEEDNVMSEWETQEWQRANEEPPYVEPYEHPHPVKPPKFR